MSESTNVAHVQFQGAVAWFRLLYSIALAPLVYLWLLMTGRPHVRLQQSERCGHGQDTENPPSATNVIPVLNVACANK
jgi:hypothetical protein